jgi:hypothetical protein
MTRVGDSEQRSSAVDDGPRQVIPNRSTTRLRHAGEGAKDVLRRHEAALQARLHRSITCTSETGQRLRADFDIQQDEDDPHAILSVVDERTGDVVRRGRASASFKLNEKSVQRFVRTGDA